MEIEEQAAGGPEEGQKGHAAAGGGEVSRVAVIDPDVVDAIALKAADVLCSLFLGVQSDTVSSVLTCGQAVAKKAWNSVPNLSPEQREALRLATLDQLEGEGDFGLKVPGVNDLWIGHRDVVGLEDLATGPEPTPVADAVGETIKVVFTFLALRGMKKSKLTANVAKPKPILPQPNGEWFYGWYVTEFQIKAAKFFVKLLGLSATTWPFQQYLQDKAMEYLYLLGARIRGQQRPTLAAWLEMRNGARQIITAMVLSELANTLLAQTEEPRSKLRIAATRQGRKTPGPKGDVAEITIEAFDGSGGDF